MQGNSGEIEYNKAFDYLRKGEGENAARCFENAIRLGHTPAYSYLAEIYENGTRGFPRDRAKAFELYKQRLNIPFSEAAPKPLLSILRMGCLYCEGGDGIQHNPAVGEMLINDALQEVERKGGYFPPDDYYRAASAYWGSSSHGLMSLCDSEFTRAIEYITKAKGCLEKALYCWNDPDSNYYNDDIYGNRKRVEEMHKLAEEQLEHVKMMQNLDKP